MIRIDKTTLLTTLLVVAAASLWSASVTIEPTKDNTMYEESDKSNGQGFYIFAGQVGPQNGSSNRRALLQFNLDGVIPAGSTVESVSLELTMNKSGVGGRQVTVHRLTKDWGEGSSDAFANEGRGISAETGDVTWTHTFYSDQFWANQGGDFVASPSATISVSGSGKYNWSGTSMVADVQAWIDNPATNFGWIVIGDETQQSSKRFYSRHWSNAADRPMLTITYSAGAATWAGYPIESDGRSVFTDSFLGWIDVGDDPYVYVYALNKYIYAPEQNISDSGGWTWIGK
ncbi:MAG: DNRLRE domain-containing protein [Puniceicoccaceae bacterium]